MPLGGAYTGASGQKDALSSGRDASEVLRLNLLSWYVNVVIYNRKDALYKMGQVAKGTILPQDDFEDVLPDS